MSNPVNFTYHGSLGLWKKLLQEGLIEDGWQWDWTTLGVLSDKKDHESQAKIIAKEAGVWAADGLIQATEWVSQEKGLPIRIQSKAKDGERLAVGDEICKWSGSTRAVLAFERTFLNLASYICGVATQTRKLTELIEKKNLDRSPKVTSTRKILPGYRELAILGVVVGGGQSHRFNLAGGILIKENHIEVAGGIQNAIENVSKVAPHGFKIEVEVKSLDELKQAVEHGADIVMLDNFSSDEVKSAIQLLPHLSKSPIIEVSGGITEENISDYAIDGVDLISVGSLTHSVRAMDLSLLIDKK